MATGLEVYESTMNPVRDAVAGIFAQQEKLRSEREAERRALEAEGRREAAAIRQEERQEERGIRTEQRVEKRAEDKLLAAEQATAARYGLPTEGKDRFQIAQMVAAHVEALPAQAFFNANRDILPQVIADPSIRMAIESGELDAQTLATYKQQFGDLIEVQRKSQADAFEKTTAKYQEEFEAAKAELDFIAARTSEIEKDFLGRQVQMAFEDTSIQDALREAAALTVTNADESIQEIFADSDYDKLRQNFTTSPHLVMAGITSISSDGSTINDMEMEEKTVLLDAFQKAQEKIAARQDNSFNKQFFLRELTIRQNALREGPLGRELSDMRSRQYKIYDKFPTLTRYNAVTRTVMPPKRKLTNETGSNESGEGSGGGSGGGGGGTGLSTNAALDLVRQRRANATASTPSANATTSTPSRAAAANVAGTPVSKLGTDAPPPTETAEPRFTPSQFNALGKMAEINETIRKYTDPGNVNSRYFFADREADEAREERDQLIADNPFLSTINRASENTGVNVGSNIGVIPPAPLMGSDYPAGYSTMVKQVESQVGQRPPQLGSSTPQPYNPQTYMRPQFPPLPPQPPRREPRVPFGPVGSPTSEFRQYLESVIGK